IQFIGRACPCLAIIRGCGISNVAFVEHHCNDHTLGEPCPVYMPHILQSVEECPDRSPVPVPFHCKVGDSHMALVCLQHIFVILQERSDKSCRTLFQQVVVSPCLGLPVSDFLFEVVEELHVCQYLIGLSILVFRHFC